MDPKVGGFALLNNLRMDAAMPVSLMATLACCNLFAFDQKMVFNPNSHEGHTSWAISYQNLKKEAYQKCKLRRFVRKSQLRQSFKESMMGLITETLCCPTGLMVVLPGYMEGTYIKDKYILYLHRSQKKAMVLIVCRKYPSAKLQQK